MVESLVPARLIQMDAYALPAQLRLFGRFSIWNKTKLDLSQSFSLCFEMFFGCLDAPGAGRMVLFCRMTHGD